MQNIYDNDYSFAKPPLKPSMTAVPGDKKVTLYWDSLSEKSMDPIYGTDFEGYRVYRSTDPGFIDSYTITDTYGNVTFKEPIAVFDLDNGLNGTSSNWVQWCSVQYGRRQWTKIYLC